MKKSDICIMLFPHSMNFSNFWNLFKDKFIVIILIDNLTMGVVKKMKKAGFQKDDLNGIGIYTYINKDNYLEKYGKHLDDVLDDNSGDPCNYSNPRCHYSDYLYSDDCENSENSDDFDNSNDSDYSDDSDDY